MEEVKTVLKSIDRLTELDILIFLKPNEIEKAISIMLNNDRIQAGIIRSNIDQLFVTEKPELLDRIKTILLKKIKFWEHMRDNPTEFKIFSANNETEYPDDVFSKEQFLRIVETKFFYIKLVLDHINSLYIKGSLTPQVNEYNYSAPEWAAAFYYAYVTKQLSPKVKKAILEFIEKHRVQTTVDNLNNKYYSVKKQINETNNYPFEKLEKIRPFIVKHYPQVVAKYDSDIEILKNESDD